MLPPEVWGCWFCCTLLWASSFVLTEFHISNMFSIMGPIGPCSTFTKTYPSHITDKSHWRNAHPYLFVSILITHCKNCQVSKLFVRSTLFKYKNLRLYLWSQVFVSSIYCVRYHCLLFLLLFINIILVINTFL